MKIIFILTITILILPYSISANDETKIDISRFHPEKQLTDEIIETFISTKMTKGEFLLLSNKSYDFNRVACYIAKNRPDEIDTYFPIGHRWIPLCNELSITKKVPEIKPLLNKYWKLGGRSSMCGTIYKDIAASLRIDNVRLGIYPEYAEERLNQYSKKTIHDNIPQLWANQGIWEREQLEKLKALESEAIVNIKSFYKNEFKLPDHQALNYTKKLIKLKRLIAFGSYPECSFSKHVSTKKIDNFLNDHNFDKLNEQVSNCTYFDNNKIKKVIVSNNQWISNMLLTAIVQRRPIKDIKELLPLLKEPMSEDLLLHPIHQSAPHYPEALKLLLDKEPEAINIQNSFGKTALMYAVQYNNIKSTKLLLSRNPDPNLATFKPESLKTYRCDGYHNLSSYGLTALDYSRKYANPEIIQLLKTNAIDYKEKAEKNE